MIGLSEVVIILGVLALVSSYLMIVRHFIRSSEEGTASVEAVRVPQTSKRDRLDSAPIVRNPVRA